MPFDELLAEVDRCAAAGVFGQDVVCQGGQSSYQLAHGRQFMARPSIDDLVAESSMVLTHGGSTVIQLLMARKPFIAFPNPRGAGDHQTSFLEQIAAVSDISWSRNVTDLGRLFKERQSRGAALLRTGFPRAGDIIRAIHDRGGDHSPRQAGARLPRNASIPSRKSRLM
jgi:UDP-N-acetylglucosamine transferase subunit ALG13